MAPQVDVRSRRRERAVADGAVGGAVGGDQTVGVQAREPRPALAADGLLQPVQQPGEGVVGWRVVLGRLPAGSFRTAHRVRACNQIVNVVEVVALRLVHRLGLAHAGATA